MQNYTLQEHIAKRIRSLRLEKGVSQEKLSEKANLGINYINNVENKFLNLKIDTLDKIIEALDVTPAEFFNFHPTHTLDRNSIKIFEEINNLPNLKKERLLEAIDLLIKNMQ